MNDDHDENYELQLPAPDWIKLKFVFYHHQHCCCHHKSHHHQYPCLHHHHLLVRFYNKKLLLCVKFHFDNHSDLGESIRGTVVMCFPPPAAPLVSGGEKGESKE